MPLYLGSTAVDDLYLGDVVYGEPNVVKVYLGTGQVWPNVYTVTFELLYDGICTLTTSLIGISSSLTAQYALTVSFTTDGPGTVQWQGSTDSGQTWDAISGFDGYHSVNAAGTTLYMNDPSSGSYRIRAVVDGIASSTVSTAGNYIEWPTCIGTP